MGNIKWVTNMFFLTDTQDAQDAQDTQDEPEDEKEDAAVAQNVMAAQVHHQEEVEAEGEEPEGQGEEDVEEDDGGEGADDEDDDDDEIQDLITSGHIKLKVNFKWVTASAKWVTLLLLVIKRVINLNVFCSRIYQMLPIPWLPTEEEGVFRGNSTWRVMTMTATTRKREVKQSKWVDLFTLCQCVPSE